MTIATEPQLRRVDHWVEFDLYHPERVDETVNIWFESEWRGRPACVLESATRRDRPGYPASELGWSMWAKDSFIGTMDDGFGREGETTPTANTHLGQAVEPLVKAWLNSTEYMASARNSYASGIKSMLSNLRSSDDTKHVRRLIEHYDSKMLPEHVARLIELCDARDAYTTLYDNTRFAQ